MAFLACVRARTMVVTGPSRSIVVVMALLSWARWRSGCGAANAAHGRARHVMRTHAAQRLSRFGIVLVSGGTVRVRAVRMGMAIVRMGGGGLDIGPAFRVERRFDRDAFAAQRNDERFQCVVAPQTNAIGKELNRHVAVAEMKGDPRQRRRVGG